jgi:hypothetical protein
MGTKWMTLPASVKQKNWILSLSDQRVVTGLSDELLDRLADVASDVAITGGEASSIIDALKVAPWKPKPSAGFAPLVSDRAERLAEAAEAQVEYERLTVLAEAALAAAGGKARALGLCVTCGDPAYSHKGEDGKCTSGEWVHYGHDSDYYHDCSCKEFIKAGPLHDAALAAQAPLAAALHRVHETDDAARDFRRGDHVVVARGRKVPKGSKGQIIKVDPDGRYGTSVFLLLDSGDRAWTALSNIDHEEEVS